MINEKKYLATLGQDLEEKAGQIKSLDDAVDVYLEVRNILVEVVQKEALLREECEVGVRFNVLQAQLKSILNEYDQEIVVDVSEDTNKQGFSLTSDEVFVYVYLFNAQGLALKTWKKLLSPEVLIEHSVNRPIYADKDQVDAVIRAKPNQAQHAYVEVAVDNNDIMRSVYGSALKDQYGYSLLRLRQGALKTENIRCFVHENKIYQVTKEGAILGKDL